MRVTEPSAPHAGPGPVGHGPAGAPDRKAGRLGSWALAALLAALALALTLKDIGDGGFRHSDASRHAMDGVFVYDFLRDLPRSVCHPVDYTLSYYAQYPALGIVLYYPPLFAIVEAAFFALFGVSPFSARLTVVFFAVLAAVMMYKLLKAMFSPRAAFVATGLFLALPTVVFWSRQVMLEMPTAAMVLSACYFFHRYVELGHRRSIIWTGLMTVLAVMTKQPAVFILPAFALYVLVRRKWEVFRHWQLYASLVLIAAVLGPYFYLTLRYAHYLTQTIVGVSSAPDGPALATNLLARSQAVLAGWQVALGDGWDRLGLLGPQGQHWLGVGLLWMAVAAGAAGCAIQLVRPKNPGVLLLALLVGIYFLQSVVLGAGVGRYAFLILPMLAAFIPALLDRLGLLRLRPVLAAACLVVAATAAYSYQRPIPVMRGHQQAMQELVRRNGKSKLVLFDGYWDGDAVFFARQSDPRRSLYVLRGSKMLYSFASFADIGQMIRVNSPQDVLDLIRNYGIHAIAVESVDVYANKHNQDDPLVRVRRMLREVLQDAGQFDLIARSRIETVDGRPDGAARLNGAEVLVYAVRQPSEAKVRDLVIPMVGLQLAIKVPLHHAGSPVVIDLPPKGAP